MTKHTRLIVHVKKQRSFIN